MIFLNSHVKGISWLTAVAVSHKILPTLYILQGNKVTRDIVVEYETENSSSWYREEGGGVFVIEASVGAIGRIADMGAADGEN